MSKSPNQHELLPWYVNETLEPGEADEFRAHLGSCASCREELELMQTIRTEAKDHGEAFFEDHPSPDRLVAMLGGELPDAEAAEVRRHLVLCADCSAEASWARGEGVVGAEASATAPHVRWGWVAAVAATILVAVFVGQRTGIDPPPSGVVRSVHVPAAERGTSGGVEITPRPGETSVLLVFDLALPESSFPVSVDFLAESGAVVRHEAGIGQDALLNRTYLHFSCDFREFPPGRYTARIQTQDSSIPDVRSFEIK